MRVSVIYFNFRETTKLVVVEEVETAILPEIRFNKAKHVDKSYVMICIACGIKYISTQFFNYYLQDTLQN